MATIKNIYSDVDIEFNKQSNGDIQKDVEIESVKNSIINIINTMPGSRRMLPTFAGYVYNLLFEPIDEITAREIGHNLVEQIRAWDNRVIIDNVHVIAVPDYNRYEVTLTFRIDSEARRSEPETLHFILTRY